MSDSALNTEKVVPEGDATNLTHEQREQVTAKLKELARGMNSPDTAVNPLEAIIQDEADVAPHSSHYDNDGWF